MEGLYEIFKDIRAWIINQDDTVKDIRAWIINQDDTVEEVSYRTWMQWMIYQHVRGAMRLGGWLPPVRVAASYVGEVEISTVFICYNALPPFLREEPDLFETMVFGGIHDNLQWRYKTREEAVEGHAAILEMIKDEQKGQDLCRHGKDLYQL